MTTTNFHHAVGSDPSLCDPDVHPIASHAELYVVVGVCEVIRGLSLWYLLVRLPYQVDPTPS